MTFRVGDKIAHPLHGAGVIERTETRRIGGVERVYLVLKIPVGDLDVMIPEETCDKIGVRIIVGPAQIDELFSAIPGIEISTNTNWNKRFRENMELIKSGDLLKVSSVIKGLMQRDREKGLSTGERKMLHSAKQIVLSEIVLSTGESYESAEARLDACMAD
ncbi:MAG: CarD family transcriptional regulator [Oscillospiraceae bacterium]|nr:CarD family transcriptional regulator [Oscillospiraceae bacterium]